MANKRITDLNLATNPQDSDVFALVNQGETRRVLYGTVKDNIVNSVVTSSLLQSSSLSGSNMIFEKGDQSTYEIDLSTIIPPGLGTSGLGWARYDDTQYTQASSLLVSGSEVAVLPNNAGNTINNLMNSPVEFYNSGTQKIQAHNNGDVYSTVVTFKAKASNANQTHIDITLSSTGATPYDRVSKSLVFAKGNDVWENFYESFHYYTDADFVTNGNQWKIEADGGDIEIADVIYFINRTFTAQ